MTRIDAVPTTIGSFESWLDHHVVSEETVLNHTMSRALDSKEVRRILQQIVLPRDELLALTHQVDVRLDSLVQKVQNGISDCSSSDAILFGDLKKAEVLLAVRKELVDQVSSLS